MVEARGLRKTYKVGVKELEVLKGIDLEVEKGEVLAVLGPSGAGKSTLRHLLGGLDSPTRLPLRQTSQTSVVYKNIHK